MAKIIDTLYEIRLLDEISKEKSIIHSLNPLSKLTVSFVYIIVTVSFDKYEILGMLPLIFYPIIIMNLSAIPYKPLLQRALLVLPFVLGIGIFNPILDRDIFTSIIGISISGGWISFISLIIKSILTVMCALILISTTGIEGIAFALRKLKVPKIFVLQLLLTYRYISLLIEEVASIWTAYSLRAPGHKGINIHVWGSLLGQLLLRTYDRGERVYNGMVLRGFNGEYPYYNTIKLNKYDLLYTLICICVIIITRIYNIPYLIGSIVIGA